MAVNLFCECSVVAEGKRGIFSIFAENLTDTDIMEIERLYHRVFGKSPASVTELPQGGSDRRYYRLASPGLPSAIGTVGSDLAENRAFTGMARLLAEAGARVPEVYAATDDCREYLQQDLGDVSLFSLLESPQGIEYVRQAMRSLPAVQNVDADPVGAITGQAPFSRRLVMWDLNYFKYCFAKQTRAVFSEAALEDDFERLADDSMRAASVLEGVMLRDCQSRNVMVHDNRTWWIDFQAARKGPCVYDLVSFLWQARARFTPEFRREMTDEYFGAWSALRHFDIAAARKSVDTFVALRTLQVLGAYGFRGVTQGRAHFLASIPMAYNNLEEILPGLSERYPELGRLCSEIASTRPFTDSADDRRLTLTVLSFSYKKGHPADWSGNGGGFLFDCRGLHNPGRYEQYKQLTGRDRPVIDFLEREPAVHKFYSAARDMVIPTVEKYRSRGFTRLQAAFGCTGGQHRSVYCAERLAREAAAAYPDVRVKLIHRERGIEETFNDV